ncbi:MAG: tetratricopeptide repeat protein, partial [Planctomycetota bacterium]|nr:tetratricopeptide repeat protein [Planctomycetota bacterium]
DEAERYYLALAAKKNSRLAGEAQFRLGALYYAAARYDAAIEAFSALEYEPADSWACSAQMGRGWALVRLGRHADAAAVFRSIQDHARLGTEARYWVGLCHKARSEWDLASQAFLAAVERLNGAAEDAAPAETGGGHPPKVTRGGLYFHAAESQLAAGRLAEALRLFERGTEIAAADDPWLDDIGRAKVQTLLEQKDYSGLEIEVQRFLARFPHSGLVPAVLRMRARAQLEQNRYGEAEAALRRLADLGAEEQASDLFLLGMAHEGQRQFAAAIEPLEAYLATADQASRRQALALLAVCCARCGRFDDARRRYEEAFAGRSEPDEEGEERLPADAAEQVAEAALEAGQFETAAGFYERVLDRQPDPSQRGRALVGLAWCRFQASDYAEADRALAAALELPLQEKLALEARLLRGRTLAKIGDLESAWEILQAVVRDGRPSPYWSEAVWSAARVAERLGRPASAIELYERIADAEPCDHTAGALYNLAWLLRERGEMRRAGARFLHLYQDHRESAYWAHAALAVAQGHLERDSCGEAEAVLGDVLASTGGKEILDRVLYLGGQVALAAKDWRLARQRFERLLAECPDSRLVAAAEFGAAEAIYHDHDPAALEHFKRIIEAARGDATTAAARLRVAQLHAEANRWDEADEQATAIAGEFPGFSEQHEVDYVLGRCLAARARLNEAREAYQRVIDSPAGQRTETAAKAQLMIAETYFHQKDYAQAFRGYMQVEIFYDYPELQAAALLQAGKCRQLAGQPGEARQLYQQVLNQYPQTLAAAEAGLRLRSGEATPEQRVASPAGSPIR